MFLNQNPWHSKIFFSFLEDSSGLVLASPFRGFFVGIFWASLQKFGQTTKTQSAVAELGEEQQSNFCLEEWWYLVSAGWVSPAPSSSAFVFKETKFWLIVFRSAKRVWLEGLEKKGRKNRVSLSIIGDDASLSRVAAPLLSKLFSLCLYHLWCWKCRFFLCLLLAPRKVTELLVFPQRS